MKKFFKFSKLLMIAFMGVVVMSSCSKDDDGDGGSSGVGSNLLPGKFSVSATKQVRFTKGNLYWDGEKYRLEVDQLRSAQLWNANHVSHFYWCNTTDFEQKGQEPYAEKYEHPATSDKDVFCFSESSPLTVEGTKGLYVLTGGEGSEWDYLLNGRENAKNLYKGNVTIATTPYCKVFAPDGYSGTIKTEYTSEEWKDAEAQGLVCLAKNSYRNGTTVTLNMYESDYWSSSLGDCGPYVLAGYCERNSSRYVGLPIRLVQTVTK